MIYFDPLTLAFYNQDWKSDYELSENWPENAVELTEQEVSEYHCTVPPDGLILGCVDGRPMWITVTPPTTEVQLELDRAALKVTRDSALADLTHDFGDGRVMQVRPQDAGNIQIAVGMGVDQEWVMADNTVAVVTPAELQTAFDAGVQGALVIWSDYMTALKAL